MIVRQRNVAIAVILSIVTCGVYAIYWFVTLTDEVSEVTGERTTSGIGAFLLTLVTCGIYGIYWAYKLGEKLDNARYRNQVPSGSFPILFLLLELFALNIVVLALAQNELNRYSPEDQ